MDARAFFQNIAARNYFEFFRHPNDLTLWNAVVSMNSVAEHLALHRLDYAPTSRTELGRSAQEIRERHDLTDLQFCADTFKHVRKIKDQRGGASFSLQATSTGVTSDRATWKIGDFDVVEVLQNAFAKLNQLPELR